MRCHYHTCKKKLSIVEKTIKCKCHLSYCMSHRIAENHACTYNYNAVKVHLEGCKHEKVIKI